EWDRSDTRQVDYVIGACQLIRREAMDQVGQLDEAIFYGPEDLDYCLRMQRKGWKVYYLATVRIIHFEQRITRKKIFTKMTFLHLKGILYLFWKYRGKLSVTPSL
ncbi:MAG: glycosyltransferase, partial [bacterium]